MTNLRDKIQSLLKNTTSVEVKMICESFLKDQTNEQNINESVLSDLKRIGSNDPAVNELLLERDNTIRSKDDIDMQISKNAAQRLMENWDSMRRDKKVNNLGIDGTYKKEKEADVVKNDILLEKLSAITDKDSSVNAYIKSAKTRSYMVKESIASIKKSQIANHASLRYVLARFESSLNEGVAEHVIVKDFLSSIHPFKWDKTVSESYDLINNQINEREADILVQNAIDEIKKTDSKRFFTDLINRMNEWLESDGKNVHDLIREMKGYSFNNVVKRLTNDILLLENTKGTQFNIPVKGTNCRIEKIYSPVLSVENGQVFKVGGSFYHSTSTDMKRLTNEQINALPKDYLTLCECFFDPSVKVVDDNIITYVGKNKVSITGDGRVFVNESQVNKDSLGTQLMYSLQTNVFGKNGNIVNNIIRLQENIEEICEIDYGKTVASNVFEGVCVHVFKKNGTIFVNKVNPSMNEDVFLTANAIQSVNLVKEFLSYDMSESLSSFLEGDYAKKAVMEGEVKSILSNISLLEEEINKIDAAILEDPSIADAPEIQEAKDLLEEELGRLKSEWQKANDDIRKFENVSEEEEDCDDEESEDVAEEPSIEKNEKEKESDDDIVVDIVVEEPEEDKSEEEVAVEDEVKAEDDDIEESLSESNDEVGIDTRVKVKSRNAQGVITAVIDGKFTVLLDNGDSTEVELNDIESIEDAIEDGLEKNEVEFQNEKKEDGIAASAEEEVPSDEDMMYVKATMSLDLGPFKEGDEVLIDASAYTAGGEDDPIKLKDPKEGVAEVPKKYLKLSADSLEPSQGITDIQTKAEALIRGFEELETMIGMEDKIGNKTIEDAKAKLKEFTDALTKEKEELNN